MVALFTCIQQLFELCLPVKEVLMLLGSTIVSPMELYRICLTEPTDYTANLSQRISTSTFFKAIVTSDLLGNATAVKTPKTLTVMVLAERDQAFSTLGLIPKVQYKIPTRGQQFNITLNNKQQGSVMTPMVNRTGELNISGIEPLDLSLCPPEAEVAHRDMDQVSGVVDMLAEVDLGDEENGQIWYQIPHTVVGYKANNVQEQRSQLLEF